MVKMTKNEKSRICQQGIGHPFKDKPQEIRVMYIQALAMSVAITSDRLEFNREYIASILADLNLELDFSKLTKHFREHPEEIIPETISPVCKDNCDTLAYSEMHPEVSFWTILAMTCENCKLLLCDNAMLYPSVSIEKQLEIWDLFLNAANYEAASTFIEVSDSMGLFSDIADNDNKVSYTGESGSLFSTTSLSYIPPLFEFVKKLAQADNFPEFLSGVRGDFYFKSWAHTLRFKEFCPEYANFLSDLGNESSCQEQREMTFWRDLGKMFATGNFTATYGDGFLVLRNAISSRNISIVTFLLSKGIDVNTLDKDGFTAIEAGMATYMTREMFRLLLDHGAVISNGVYENILYGENSECFLELNGRGFKLSSNCIIRCMRPKLAKMYLENGGNPNLKYRHGETDEIDQYLDPAEWNGISWVDRARKDRDHELIGILKEYGAVPSFDVMTLEQMAQETLDCLSSAAEKFENQP